MTIREGILSWLRRRREKARRIEVEARALIRDLGSEAYAEARLMRRQAKSADERRHWRRVALTIARKSGNRIALDPATSNARAADFSDAIAQAGGRSRPD
jgi:hypothetical protein